MTVQELFDKTVYAIVAATIAGFGVLVRRVFTNEKQIALLHQHIQRRDEDIKEIKTDVKELIRKAD